VASLLQFNTLQIEEINRHKWIESEKCGYDVGLIYASLDWIHKHAKQFRAEFFNDKGEE